MTAPDEQHPRESLLETFNSKPGTYLAGGLAILAFGAATGGRSMSGLARAGLSAVLTQGANLLMDNRKHDDPRAGAATWLGVSLLGNLALNMTRPGGALAERFLPALADSQISTATGFAVKAVNSGVESVGARMGFGALAGAIGGASSAAAQMRGDGVESAVQAMGSAAVAKAGQRVATIGVQELGKRIGELHPPSAPAPPPQTMPTQQKQPPGPTIN